MDDLTEAGATLKRKYGVAGFLGVDISRSDKGTITMTQTGLTDRIITALGLDDANTKKYPPKLVHFLKMLMAMNVMASSIMRALLGCFYI